MTRDVYDSMDVDLLWNWFYVCMIILTVHITECCRHDVDDKKAHMLFHVDDNRIYHQGHPNCPVARWSFGLRMSKQRHGWVWMICKLHSQNNTSVMCMKGWEGMKLMKTFCLDPFTSAWRTQEPVEWQLTLLTCFRVSSSIIDHHYATQAIPMLLREGMHFELQAEAPLRVRFLIYERAVKDGHADIFCTAGPWCLGVAGAWVYCRSRSFLVPTNFGMLICSEFLRHVGTCSTSLKLNEMRLHGLGPSCT